jgi:hypothetical protein
MEKPILTEWARFAEDVFGVYISIVGMSTCIPIRKKQMGMRRILILRKIGGPKNRSQL